MIKKGFTLSELILTLGIIGVIAVILLPSLKNIIPNQEQAMFKKAYYLTERNIAEMINDEDFYPVAGADDEGFADTAQITTKWGNLSGNTKFCQIFAHKLNRTSSINCTAESATGGPVFTANANPVGTVTTTDGMVWIIPVTSFKNASNVLQNADIKIDVNGNKKPNCFYNANTCKRPDRFTITIHPDGEVSVNGTMEIEYIRKVNISKDSKTETFNED